ncbi:MAG: hypothetical protein LAP13_10660 [Acidobacteriia bacterium]|nr:hypothetical protein [Terriglobia bacterium]
MALPSNAPMGTGLSFSGMKDLGIGFGFDLQYGLVDRSLELYLCVGKEDIRVLVTGTTPSSRQAAVLKAIDEFGKWGENIQLWMVSEKNGVLKARTRPVNYLTHVKPYYGKLTISEIAADQPAMTYAGLREGRLLSKLINNHYYFHLGGKRETNNQKRGFDCTSFPMALLSISYLPGDGYGKQLCDAAHAAPCGLEQKKSADFKEQFKNKSIPGGIYILFSEFHVLLYNSDKNSLYEFNFGGFRDTTPANLRDLAVPGRRDLWWMRKLDEKYRQCFM